MLSQTPSKQEWSVMSAFAVENGVTLTLCDAIYWNAWGKIMFLLKSSIQHFEFICLPLWASWRHLGSRYQKRPQKIKLVSPVLGAILGNFCFQIDFNCIFCVSIFVVVFGIAFGTSLVPFLKIWGSFQGTFWGHFEYFLADAAELKKWNLFKRNADLGGVGPPFLHDFC